MIRFIISWLIGTALFAVPVWIGAKLVNARLNDYGWACIATFLYLGVQIVIGMFVPSPLIGIPLALVGGVLIFSFALGTSWPKAALVSLAPLSFLALLSLLSYFLLGDVKVCFYGHEFTFVR